MEPGRRLLWRQPDPSHNKVRGRVHGGILSNDVCYIAQRKYHEESSNTFAHRYPSETRVLDENPHVCFHLLPSPSIPATLTDLVNQQVAL